MANISDFDIGGRYTFATHAPSILGTAFSNVKITSILLPEDAIRFGTDIAALHASVLPSLPTPKPDNYLSYSYIKGVTQNDTPFVLGLPWIDGSTIVSVGAVTKKFVVDNVTPAIEANIIEAISTIGYSVNRVE